VKTYNILSGSRKPADFTKSKTILAEHLNDHRKLLQSIRALQEVILEEIALLQKSVVALQDNITEVPSLKMSTKKETKRYKSLSIKLFLLTPHCRDTLQPVPPTPVHLRFLPVSEQSLSLIMNE
jgi:hypothetical protein